MGLEDEGIFLGGLEFGRLDRMNLGFGKGIGIFLGVVRIWIEEVAALFGYFIFIRHFFIMCLGYGDSALWFFILDLFDFEIVCGMGEESYIIWINIPSQSDRKTI